jgi:hypothetical protein
MGLFSSVLESGAGEAAPGEPQARVRPQFHRLTLVLAIIATAAVVLAVTLSLAPAPQVEPDLMRLLRGMVLIKGLIALGAAALVWWRLGRPVEQGLATRYTAALSLSAGALAWLWGLHLVLLGSLFFYAGLIGLVLTGRRDPLLSAQPPKAQSTRT